MTLRRDALGLGLRRPHLDALLEGPPAVDYLEILVDNHLDPGDLARDRLGEVAARYPLVGHGVSADLAGAAPLDLGLVDRVGALVRAHGLAFASDHLCWSASGGHRHHDLLPVPPASDLVGYVAARVRAVQDRLGVPFGVENVSAYVGWRRGDLSEGEFYRRVVREADAGYLLDLNNLYVSARNRGFDPMDWLRDLEWDRVLQVHLAGHRVRPDGLRHDTHDRPVCDEVWALYREAWRRGGPFPTLLEWDDDLPPLAVAVAELRRAVEVRGG